MMGILAKGIQILTLEPIFGDKTWSPRSSCADVHPHGELPDGSKCCCMAGHESGVEWDRRLVRTDADLQEIAAWQPEKGRDEWSESEPPSDKPQPTRYEGVPKPVPVETRRQRRAKKAAQRQAQAATSSPN
jgi:hypothetical protein